MNQLNRIEKKLDLLLLLRGYKSDEVSYLIRTTEDASQTVREGEQLNEDG